MTKKAPAIKIPHAPWCAIATCALARAEPSLFCRHVFLFFSSITFPPFWPTPKKRSRSSVQSIACLFFSTGRFLCCRKDTKKKEGETACLATRCRQLSHRFFVVGLSTTLIYFFFQLGGGPYGAVQWSHKRGKKRNTNRRPTSDDYRRDRTKSFFNKKKRKIKGAARAHHPKHKRQGKRTGRKGSRD